MFFTTISKQQYETRSKSPSRNPRVQGTAAIQNYWFGAGGPATTITGSRSLSNKLVAVKRRLFACGLDGRLQSTRGYERPTLFLLLKMPSIANGPGPLKTRAARHATYRRSTSKPGGPN